MQFFLVNFFFSINDLTFPEIIIWELFLKSHFLVCSIDMLAITIAFNYPFLIQLHKFIYPEG